MSTNTMRFGLPETMGSDLDQGLPVQRGKTSEYLRELIAEGLDSGPGRALTPQRAAQLKKQALGTKLLTKSA
jgi:hypothetical protein